MEILRLIPKALGAAIPLAGAIIGVFTLLEQTKQKIKLSSEQLKDIHTHLTAGLPFDLANHLEDYLVEYLGTAEDPVPFGGRAKELKDLWSHI